MSKQSSRLLAAAAVAAAAIVVLTGFGRPTAAVAPAAFRTADGSTACAALASGAIACRTRGTARALVLHPDGRSNATALALVWTHGTDVLLAAESWWRGDTVCRAAAARVRCSARGGTISLAGRH